MKPIHLVFLLFTVQPLSAQTTYAGPPPSPVRHIAEWEELQAIAITWRSYPTILREIVRHAKEEARVVVICRNAQVKTDATNELLNHGISLDNVGFLIANNNSVWIRDYGPNGVYANDVDSLFFIDWAYNRPSRPMDDLIPGALGQYFGTAVYSTTAAPNDLVATGGNFMSDGLGTAFSSKLILNENATGNIFNAGPHDESGINAIMNGYMGIHRYIKMETLPFDGIHHIDMHIRLLDEETLLVGQYPPGTSDGPQIEANIEYVLSHFTSPFGSPYKVVRVLQPPDFGGTYPPQGNYRTYTNAVFINKTILVPTYEEQFDSIALRVYRAYYPGYKVVGINCNQMIAASGALHCITKEIGATEPLWIVHQKLTDVMDNAALGDYEVDAAIKSKSGIAAARIYFTTDTLAGFQVSEMTLANGPGSTWSGFIPHQEDGKGVFYYIQAEANSGKQQVRPLTAPKGYFYFKVGNQVSYASERDGIEFKDIYPNPANAVTVIPVQALKPEKAKIEVIDVMGRVVEMLFDGQLTVGEARFFIDAGNYRPGTYFVTLKTDRGLKAQKLMVR